jgi:predicted transcriptional regulator
MKGQKNLSRRERQIMDIVYVMGKVSVAQVLERIPNPPSYSAIRALLKVLEKKGHLTHKQEGPRYIYFPTLPREEARQNALKHIKKTFFDNSTEDIVAALLNNSTEDIVAALLNITEGSLSEKDYKRLSELIKKARKEGR